VNESSHAIAGSSWIACMATAWIGLSEPPVAYAACGWPANTSVIPFAIIRPPTICAPTRATSAMRIATRMLSGTDELARNEAIASVTITAMITAPPNARLRATIASNAVSTLKCDGTPRHVCIETSAVSNPHAIANAPINLARARSPSLMNDDSHAIVISVRPNEKPNDIGLRHDSGPSHVAPVTIRIARWISPLSINSAPIV
jgi:hypothetical protein